MLLYTKGSKNAKKQYNSGNNSKKKCTYCEREGHEVLDCFWKQRGEPPGGKSEKKKNKGQKAMCIPRTTAL